MTHCIACKKEQDETFIAEFVDEEHNTGICGDCYIEEPKLENGCLPPHFRCPYKERCGYDDQCHHKGIEHDISFSCAIARGFKMIEENKSRRSEG